MIRFRNKGFTLIELLVAMAIIGLLSSVVWVNITEMRKKAMIVKTQQDIIQIVTAMYLFKDNNRELPPIGDICSACNDPCGSGLGGMNWAGGSWITVMDALVEKRLIDRVDRDAWGNGFCYDDNDGVNGGAVSALYSMGPNEQNESINSWWDCNPKFKGDDFGIFLPYGSYSC